MFFLIIEEEDADDKKPPVNERIIPGSFIDFHFKRNSIKFL